MSKKPLYVIAFIFALMPGQSLAQQGAMPSVPIVQGNGPYPPPAPRASARGVSRILPTSSSTPATVPVRAPAPAPAPVAPAPVATASVAPASTLPAENPNVPLVMGSGRSGPLLPLPPHVPEYLPNGAPNLDWDWTEDGGARLYWNDVLIPQQLRMAGATWIDPALVPQLLPDRPAPRKRSYRRRTARVKSKAPVNAASTALNAPAIPLPVSPGKDEKTETTDTKPIPPLKAPAKAAAPKKTAHKAPAKATRPAAPPVQVTPANTEDITVTPPPLQ